MAEILTTARKAEIGRRIEETYRQLVNSFAFVQDSISTLQAIKSQMQADPTTFTPDDIEVVDALLWAINQYVDTTKTPSNDINQVIQDYRNATVSSG